MERDNELMYTLTAALQQICINKGIRDIDFVISNAALDVYHDCLNHMVLSLRSYVLQNSDAAEKVFLCEYRTWWDHFKADCFPRWVTKLFKVRINYERHEAYKVQQVRVCPHLPIKVQPHQYQVHMNFIQNGVE